MPHARCKLVYALGLFLEGDLPDDAVGHTAEQGKTESLSVESMESLRNTMAPSAMPKLAPPMWSLPGDSKNLLFMPPGLVWSGSVEQVNKVAQPPKAQPS